MPHPRRFIKLLIQAIAQTFCNLERREQTFMVRSALWRSDLPPARPRGCRCSRRTPEGVGPGPVNWSADESQIDSIRERRYQMTSQPVPDCASLNLHALKHMQSELTEDYRDMIHAAAEIENRRKAFLRK